MANSYRMLNSLHLSKYSDDRVFTGLTRLVNQERRLKSAFLVYLNEVDRRKLYAKKGYSSLFRFLTEHFQMSESSALKRIQVARLASKYPFLHKSIAQGVFSLSALSRLAPFVKSYNSEMLFGACKNKGVRFVESFLAEKFPKADVEDRLQKKVSPLGPDRLHIQFTADQAFVSDLEKATALLSHRYPQGRMSDVMGLALKTLIRELEKEPKRIPRGMQEEKQLLPAIVPGKPMLNRHIPRGIRCEIWRRDEAKCQHRKPDGRICGETRFLELDHIQPFALGGGHDKENLRLLCWAHNQLRGETTFGRRHTLKT